jgi:uncharacterized protein YbjQ (UPF0145 family)
MLVITAENIPGKSYTILGMVKGGIVQSKHIGRDIGASLKTLIGGELTGYTEMMNEARAMATKRMVEEAQKLEADAIICVRYMSSSVAAGAAEVVAYGTAVKFS